MLTKDIIPKPSFKSCDETSLKLFWESPAFSAIVEKPNYEVKLQYKEIHEPWEQAKEHATNAKKSEVSITEMDVVDLNPGTPYFVRLAIYNNDDGSVVYGPDTVFDTRPVDCVPKRKRCIIS
jgi:hypothetical protein